MLKINNAYVTISEAKLLIQATPGAWKKQFPYYLPKIDRSGSTTFAALADLMTVLNGYIAKEQGLDPQQLERARGLVQSTNFAVWLDPIPAAKVNTADVAAIAWLMAGNTSGNGVSNESPHATDPETGQAKGTGVSVKEYYINGDQGRRAVKRSENGHVTYYYSQGHAANTYTYNLLR